MGIRGELHSTTVSLENRTYFFNVKENRLGDLYLNIVESKNKDGGGFERQSLVLFADDLQQFLKGFDESLKVMEKAARDKKQARAEKQAAKAERYGERPPQADDGHKRYGKAKPAGFDKRDGKADSHGKGTGFKKAAYAGKGAPKAHDGTGPAPADKARKPRVLKAVRKAPEPKE